LFLFAALRLQFSLGFRSLGFLGGQRGRNGTVRREVGGVDVPAGIDFSCEDNIHLCGRYLLLAYREVDGVVHLRQSRQRHHYNKEQTCSSFHIVVQHYFNNCRQNYKKLF